MEISNHATSNLRSFLERNEMDIAESVTMFIGMYQVFIEVVGREPVGVPEDQLLNTEDARTLAGIYDPIKRNHFLRAHGVDVPESYPHPHII